MPDAKRQVEELRQEIAKIDSHLLASLEKRARASRRLRELRGDQPPQLPVSDHAAIRGLVARSTGEMPEEALFDIFREVYAACLAIELPIKVAYVGAEGGPGHVAAGDRFGRTSNLIATETPGAALEEVARRRAEFAVAPFETSEDGHVRSTLFALVASELRVIEMLESSPDRAGDRVRYAVVGNRPSGRTGQDATSLAFSVRDRAGSLLDVLRVLAERGINITNIQSHPVRDEGWSYLFCLELPGHFTDRPLVAAFEEIKRAARSFRVLGSYPKA